MEEVYKIVDVIVKAQKKARKDNDFFGLMKNAEALLEYIPQLIDYSINREHEYRKFESQILNSVTENAKPVTSSYAETQAKATDAYRDWQKAKQTIDWMYEMVNMSKKLAGTVLKDEQNG